MMMLDLHGIRKFDISQALRICLGQGPAIIGNTSSGRATIYGQQQYKIKTKGGGAPR
jgi:hypothetical protein